MGIHGYVPTILRYNALPSVLLGEACSHSAQHQRMRMMPLARTAAEADTAEHRVRTGGTAFVRVRKERRPLPAVKVKPYREKLDDVNDMSDDMGSHDEEMYQAALTPDSNGPRPEKSPATLRHPTKGPGWPNSSTQRSALGSAWKKKTPIFNSFRSLSSPGQVPRKTLPALTTPIHTRHFGRTSRAAQTRGFLSSFPSQTFLGQQTLAAGST
jgi:hypothetical protein